MLSGAQHFVAEMQRHGVRCGPIQDQGWGMLTHLTLPGGGTLGVYQPRHVRPPQIAVRGASSRKTRRTSPGGDIMIHGLPNGMGAIGKSHVLRDWTQGCIAVTNPEIEEIWRVVPNGTRVEIQP